MDLLNMYIDGQKHDLTLDYKYRREDLGKLNRAYARMLLEQQLLSPEDFAVIDAGLKAVQDKVQECDLDPRKGDIHFLYEAALYEEIGAETACKLHVGRSRNDMYFAMWRMSVRTALQQVMRVTLELQKALEQLAAEHLETVIPYFTYGQPAQPGTWAHYLMTVHEMLEGDMKRMKAAYATVNRSPMGAAAGIGTAFPLNKYRVSELLGFDGVIENTNTGNAAVDYYLETISAFAILNTTLSRVSSDLIFFATPESNIFNADMGLCGGSSIMPQKKNLQSAEEVRSLSNLLPGYMMSAFQAAASSTLFPAHETYQFFRNFWSSVELLIFCLRTTQATLVHSKINKEIALKRAADGFTAATGMAEQLTMELGEPFSRTHHIVGGMIHTLMDQDKLALENMTSDLMKEASVQAVGFEVVRTDEQIARMLDPLASLNAKVTGGTPKPEDTRKLLEAGAAVRAENEAWLADAIAKVAAAFAKLDQ